MFHFPWSRAPDACVLVREKQINDQEEENWDELLS